jgi:hypothetical protein
MTTQQDKSRAADRGSSPAGLALVVVALVLAFLVGRFTAGMGRSAGAPHETQDSADVVKEVDDLFGKLSKNGTWDDAADRQFIQSVSRLGQTGQVRELAMLATKINKGELKRVREPQAPKPQCEPKLPPCEPKPQKSPTKAQ